VSLEQFVGRLRTQGKLLFCEFYVARSSCFVDVCDAEMVEQNIQRVYLNNWFIIPLKSSGFSN
jgi:hypothetical protein